MMRSLCTHLLLAATVTLGGCAALTDTGRWAEGDPVPPRPGQAGAPGADDPWGSGSSSIMSEEDLAASIEDSVAALQAETPRRRRAWRDEPQVVQADEPADPSPADDLETAQTETVTEPLAQTAALRLPSLTMAPVYDEDEAPAARSSDWPSNDRGEDLSDETGDAEAAQAYRYTQEVLARQSDDGAIEADRLWEERDRTARDRETEISVSEVNPVFDPRAYQSATADLRSVDEGPVEPVALDPVPAVREEEPVERAPVMPDPEPVAPPVIAEAPRVIETQSDPFDDAPLDEAPFSSLTPDPAQDAFQRGRGAVTAARRTGNGGAYTLGAGDELRVIVFGEDNLSGAFQVDATGVISMPLIGQVQAQGLTVRELQADIADALNYYLINPRVSMELTKYRPFYIHGEVNEGGEFPFVADMHVLTAIGMAGGYTPRASKSRVYISRPGLDGELEEPATVETKILPGDVVRIPERRF